ncbi:hypothetical protein DSO57_1026496 [Entomophthora muscae]|uniref:Uncharacterized protein n=1 Tax=Entomophthora muscae TaxID=34485 RepID=A0ACC2RGQ5_9FUNG|nr:hypothetical protein DSO57_1026496 [Entomophthora muscae]
MKGIPLITGVQSIDGFSIVNTPFITFSPSYGSITTDELGFFRRFKDKIIDPLVFSYHFSPVAKSVNKIREKYSVPPAKTHLGDLKNSLTLVNTFIGFEAAAQIPPNIKLIGPVKYNIFDPLPAKLESLIHNHPRTLYIGFGSQVMLADFDIANLAEGSLCALNEGSIDVSCIYFWEV